MQEYLVTPNGDLTLQRTYEGIGDLVSEKVYNFIIDSKYIYIYTNDQSLYIIRHSVPAAFTPTYHIYQLPNTFQIVQLPPSSLAASSEQLSYFFLLHQDRTISILSFFNSTSYEMACQAFQKPNQFSVFVSGYTNKCQVQYSIIGDQSGQF